MDYENIRMDITVEAGGGDVNETVTLHRVAERVQIILRCDTAQTGGSLLVTKNMAGGEASIMGFELLAGVQDFSYTKDDLHIHGGSELRVTSTGLVGAYDLEVVFR